MRTLVAVVAARRHARVRPGQGKPDAKTETKTETTTETKTSVSEVGS